MPAKPAIEAIQQRKAQGRTPTSGRSLGWAPISAVRRADLDAALGLLRRAAEAHGSDLLEVAPSCSLLHVPLSLKNETQIDQELKSWLAFAEEKLQEVVTLAHLLEGNADMAVLVENGHTIPSLDTLAKIATAMELGMGGLAWFWDEFPPAERFLLSAIAYLTRTGVPLRSSRMAFDRALTANLVAQ